MPDENVNHVDELIDARELPCPKPLLLTKKKIQTLHQGAIVKVLTRDPSFKIDIAVFAKKSGHTLLRTWQEDQHYISIIKKSN